MVRNECAPYNVKSFDPARAGVRGRSGLKTVHWTVFAPRTGAGPSLTPPRPAPDLGTARRRWFWSLYLSTPPTEFLLATDANAPSRGEVGRGPAALKRLDSGRREGR